jgi:hypothetical protein
MAWIYAHFLTRILPIAMRWHRSSLSTQEQWFYSWYIINQAGKHNLDIEKSNLINLFLKIVRDNIASQNLKIHNSDQS